MDGSSALKGLPHVTGEYRFPVTSWEAEQDACRDACAARIRHAAVQQGGIPRGPVTVVELRRTEPMGEEVPAYIYVRAEVAAVATEGLAAVSVLVTLNCDARAVVAGQDVGTCGTVRHCLVLTAEEAREQSKAQGWSRRGGKDLCPLHTREVQEYMRGHRGRPKR